MCFSHLKIMTFHTRKSERLKILVDREYSGSNPVTKKQHSVSSSMLFDNKGYQSVRSFIEEQIFPMQVRVPALHGLADHKTGRYAAILHTLAPVLDSFQVSHLSRPIFRNRSAEQPRCP